MNKIITLAAVVVLLFLILAGCVGYVGYGDYDYPHGHGYYFNEPYSHGYHDYGYAHHGGHQGHDFDRDDR